MGVTVSKNMGRLTVDDDNDDDSSPAPKADSEVDTPMQYFRPEGLWPIHILGAGCWWDCI